MDKTLTNEAFAQHQHESAMRLCFEEAYKGFTLDTDPVRAQRSAGSMAEAVKNASVLIPSVWGAAACTVLHTLDEIKPLRPQTILDDAAAGIGKGLAYYTVGRACSPMARAFVRPGIQELTTRLSEDAAATPETPMRYATIESSKGSVETLRQIVGELAIPLPTVHFDFPAVRQPDADSQQQAFRAQEIRQARFARFEQIEKTEQSLMSKSTQFCTPGQTPAYRQMLDSLRRAKHTVRM